MRKLLAIGTGMLVACAALAVPTVAQAPTGTVISVDAKVIPKKAGTKKKPQGVKIKVKGHLTTPEGIEKPIVQKVVVLFPRAGDYNGADYPKCSMRTLNLKGPDACPRKSLMGGGYAISYADTVLTRANITVFNGGAKRSFGYVTMSNPARVQTAVPGDIKKLNHPKWKYRLTVTIPEKLQVVAGIPIAARDLYMSVGGKPYAKNWITTTSCPRSKRWPYHVDAFLSTGETVKYDDSVPCL